MMARYWMTVGKVGLWTALCAGALQAEESTVQTATLYPEADTYIQTNVRDGNFGAATFLSAAAARESLLRFNLTSVSQVKSAKIRLYIGQFGAEGDQKPILFRTIRDIAWDEMAVTRNSMDYEVPFKDYQSPWVGTSDPQFAGWTLATNVNTWIEADVTEAVKQAAQGAGKITFHAYSPGPDGNKVVSTMPITFYSRESGGTELGPQLVVEYAGAGNEAKGGYHYDSIPTDDVTLEATIRRGPGHGTGDAAKAALLANKYGRSGLMKFDVGSFVGRFDARQVESATLELRGEGSSNATSTKWDLMVEDAGDWSEDTIQNNALPPNVKPYTYTMPAAVPANAIRFTSWNATSNHVTKIDVTALMKQAAAFSSGFVTFQFVADNGYVICGCKDYGDPNVAPRLRVTFRRAPVEVARDATGVKIDWTPVDGATAYHVERAVSCEGPWTRIVADAASTTVYDPSYPGRYEWWYRVVSVQDGVETAQPPVRFYEKPDEAERIALQNASAFFDNGTLSASCTGANLQCGNPQNYRVLYTYLVFDPSGLEQAPYVRLRLRSWGANNHLDSELRILGAVTDLWTPENVAWGNPVNAFRELPNITTDGNSAHPCMPATGMDLPNELGRLKYPVYGSDYVHFLEADVTELAHAAARQKRYVTIVLATTHFDYWRMFSSKDATSAGHRPKLVFPSTIGFNTIAATDDLTDEKPAVDLSWGAAAEGATYTVERIVPTRNERKTLATGVTTNIFTDTKTWPDASVYRVTATFPDGQTAVQEVTHTIAAETRITSDADTFVYDGQNGTRFGLENRMVMKYSAAQGLTREGLFRFDLSEAPRDAKAVSMTIRVTSMGDFTGNETLYVRTMDDILLDGQPWTDAHAPTWNEAFPDRAGQKKASEAASEGYQFAVPSNQLGADTPLTFDVTSLVAAAHAAGKSALTFHIYLKDPNSRANCGFYTKENAMACYAPYLSFQPKNWNTAGTVILVR